MTVRHSNTPFIISIISVSALHIRIFEAFVGLILLLVLKKLTITLVSYAANGLFFLRWKIIRLNVCLVIFLIIVELLNMI